MSSEELISSILAERSDGSESSLCSMNTSRQWILEMQDEPNDDKSSGYDGQRVCHDGMRYRGHCGKILWATYARQQLSKRCKGMERVVGGACLRST